MTKLTSRVALFLATAFAVSAVLAAEPFPSTYQVPVNPPLLIQGAVVLTGTGERIDGADVLIENGRIKAIGQDLTAPAGARIVNAQGRWVTPGLIDIHSHLGVYASPGVKGLDDGNEATSPNTANVWAEHSVWPQDPGFETALEGGVTTLQILPGSANLIGGRSVVLKNVHAVTYQAMKFPGAAYGLKMACGENPKRVYGEKNQAPSTRMGNVAGYRQAFADAQDYQQQWDKYLQNRRSPGPEGCLRGDVGGLVGVQDGSLRRHTGEFADGRLPGAKLRHRPLGLGGWHTAFEPTANPAEILGLGATRGRIAVGQVADLVLWSADPLEVTTLADKVWIHGHPIEMRSRQTELRDRYIELVKAHRAL